MALNVKKLSLRPDAVNLQTYQAQIGLAVVNSPSLEC